MLSTFLDLADEQKSSIWLILLICFILYVWTTFVCYLPMWISCSQSALSIVSAVSYLITACIEFVKLPEDRGFDSNQIKKYIDGIRDINKAI